MGVSRRTLFNYFRNKEDFALGGLGEQGETIAERPSDEDAWTSLRVAFQTLDEIETAAERRLEFVTFLFGHESLRASAWAYCSVRPLRHGHSVHSPAVLNAFGPRWQRRDAREKRNRGASCRQTRN